MDKKYCPYCMNPVKEGETCTNCGLTEGVYTPRDHHLPLGSVLNDRYLVGRVLGEGGFGITYIGCDLNLEMKVAIKEYFPIDRVYRFSKASLDVSNYAHAAEKFRSGKVKFLQEARTMARLDKQQNIVSVRDFFEKNNTAYIVMEYVEGTTLKELVNQRGGRIPAGELLYMLEPLFPALTSVHELGLIHRDISPDNLMLENGKIKLLDFGCARESASQSETMTIALKQGYAPIEQYQHKGQGAWTDVYALSATIYYCLTGKTPQSAVDRLNEEELVPPRRLGVDLTADQEAALLKGMNVKAKDRFQSVEELFAALYTNVLPEPIPEEAASEETVAAEPIPSEMVSDETASETDSGIGEDMRNDTPDNAEIQDSAEGPALPEVDRDEKQPAKGRIPAAFSALKQQLKKRNPVIILAGCAVLLAAAICIVWAVLPSKEDTEVTLNPNGTGTSTDDLQPGSQADPVKEFETMETLFADAVTLEESSINRLQMLMDDETVPAIRIPEGVDAGSMYGAITITKPVLIEKNVSFFFTDPITVQGENAYLWIEGDLGANSILRTVGGGRIVANSSDCIFAEVLWLEREDDVRILNGEKPVYNDKIVGGKNTLFQDAVEVFDETEMRQAIAAGQSVCIGYDMTITMPLDSNVSIWIEKGVTVSLQYNTNLVGSGAFLWNEGRIEGAYLCADSGAEVINYGEISTDNLEVNDILVNLGELDIISCYSSDEQGRICNIGTLQFEREESCFYNVNTINCGTMICSSDYVDFHFGASITNFGEFRMESGYTSLKTYLKNVSDGKVLLCDNAALQNCGVIEIFSGEFVREAKSILYNESGAIYHYFYYTDDYPQEGWIHFANIHVESNVFCVSQVADFGELYDALQDPEVDKICLTGTVSWNTDGPLTLTKEMEIPDGAELIMGEGTELILDGGSLQNRGYLKINNLTLTHGSSLRNHYGTIELNSSESVIKLGNVNGERNYGGTDCLMNDEGEILYNCEIDLYDDALMIQKGYLEGPSFHILGHAYVANMGEIQWGDEGIIEISGRGQFHNMGQQDWSQNLSINIGNNGVFRNLGRLIIKSGDLYVASDGSLETLSGDITFGNNLSIRNDGRLYFCVGRDSALLQGYLENYGSIDIDASSGFVINGPSAWLNNYGEAHILDPEGYIKILNGEFTGNEAIYY